MDIKSFLKNPGYIINHYPGIDMYEAILDQSTHDITFYYQNGKLTNYEAYNKLTDGSCILTDKDILLLENWIKPKIFKINLN